MHRMRHTAVLEMGSATTQLRILATTDLHMNVLGYDYAFDTPGQRAGLSGLAPLIAKARADVAQGLCVLVDNGDFLQGNPLADWLSTQDVTPDHPLVASFNGLAYDAIGLGNHDLDYRTAYLEQFIAALDAPVISTNLSDSGISGLHPSVLLTRQIETTDGPLPLKIGIVSALPDETAVWNKAMLPETAIVADPLASLPAHVARLRQAGADIVLALAHLGLGHAGAPDSSADAGALALAEIPGIDAIVAGHTHRRFPDGTASDNGYPSNVPVVMPGLRGSDLGVIDLDLARTPDGHWVVMKHGAQLWPQPVSAAPDPVIYARASQAHTAARADLAAPIGNPVDHLHSYFALLQPAKTMALSARAKAILIREALQGSPHADLPLLAAAAARAVGGAGGVRNYIDVPKGFMMRRHLAGFAPFENRTCALLLTGAQLRLWLERSAHVYSHLGANIPRQNLLNPAEPSFIFDAIYGLTYTIDPAQPQGQRISQMAHAGAAVSPDQQFVLATNTFRAAGGGRYDTIDLPPPIAQSPATPTESLIRALKSDEFDAWTTQAPWQLKRHGLTAIYETSPKAAAYLDEIAAFKPRILGQTDNGFDRIEITL